MCAELRPIATRTEIVILRHAAERVKASNSGRIAHLALTGSVLLDHGEPHVVIDPSAVSQPGTWLLFPEGPVCTVAPEPLPVRLVVLDGTWHQARHMRQRISALRGLPVLHVEATSAAGRLRESPSPGHVSTLEALAAALRLLEGDAPADELERLYRLLMYGGRCSGRRPPGP